jgi:ketosteroid isomerase-like protein
MSRLALPLSLFLLGAVSAADAARPDVATIIRQQSQAFSDASASGDAKTLARYLDDRVTFMNEDGRIATKKDIVDSAAPSNNPRVRNTLVQEDFTVQVYGSTAVTSFTDVSTVDFYGQQAHFRFRSTEVWHASRGQWKMISSQTLYEPKDPPAIQLAPAMLDEYAGRYALGPDLAFDVSREGDGLKFVRGEQVILMKPETRDVFFVPGQPLNRRIMQRDATGAITGMVNRRMGSDFVYRKVS